MITPKISAKQTATLLMLLAAWELSAPPTTLETSSGRSVLVTNGAAADATTGTTRWAPRLRGEGRVVFRGTFTELRASTL